MTTEPTTTSPSPTTPHEPVTAAPGVRRPRIRAGAIVWGLVVAAVSVLLLAFSADPGLRAGILERVAELGQGAGAALGIAALGAIALLVGLVRVLDRR
ncbi:hypothetical protein SAMN06295885_3360 [Rathayibacter oskolensis]|uniref:Uncharacterized protein n=1 Tax=Rathayibacter oskolensis TaxID=1891671 RepID=A0A1X7PFN4_9MICO|nr:hypothetical protein [Rathayibacter oskolensis]SMH49592.1 hypothetical protein SAMN06295885_3360 [Rathayibacter oskolensis]